MWSGGCCRYGWTAVYLSVNGVHFVRILSGSSTEGHRQCQERGGSQEGCPNASAGVPFCSVATAARKARMGRFAANSECKLGRFCSSTRAGHRWPSALALRRPRARKGRVRCHKGARQDSRRCRPIGLFWPELKISELLNAPARPWHGRARGAPCSARGPEGAKAGGATASASAGADCKPLCSVCFLGVPEIILYGGLKRYPSKSGQGQFGASIADMFGILGSPEPHAANSRADHKATGPWPFEPFGGRVGASDRGASCTLPDLCHDTPRGTGLGRTGPGPVPLAPRQLADQCRGLRKSYVPRAAAHAAWLRGSGSQSARVRVCGSPYVSL